MAALSSCCAPSAQATCCEPSAKEACCGTSAPASTTREAAGCGCSAGRPGTAVSSSDGASG